jgi:hypothetical protein
MVKRCLNIILSFVLPSTLNIAQPQLKLITNTAVDENLYARNHIFQNQPVNP